jgi:hypothetical protein
MGFSAEVASSVDTGRVRIPFEDTEFRIAALNYEPVIWVVADPSADFASEFLKKGHAGHFAS